MNAATPAGVMMNRGPLEEPGVDNSPAGAAAEERTNVGGRSTRYLTAGEGPPLVLLHALGENALDWSWVLPALSRGHLPQVERPDRFADVLARFLDESGRSG